MTVPTNRHEGTWRRLLRKAAAQARDLVLCRRAVTELYGRPGGNGICPAQRQLITGEFGVAGQMPKTRSLALGLRPPLACRPRPRGRAGPSHMSPRRLAYAKRLQAAHIPSRTKGILQAISVHRVWKQKSLLSARKSWTVCIQLQPEAAAPCGVGQASGG